MYQMWGRTDMETSTIRSQKLRAQTTEKNPNTKGRERNMAP